MLASALKPLTNSFINECKTRLKIGFFMILVWQLSLIIYPPSMSIYLMMVIAVLIDTASISIISKFATNKNVSRDINEINLYAIILHIFVVVTYYCGIKSDYHNYGIWFLFGLTILRLFYFGKKTESGDYGGFPQLGLLEYIQKRISTKNPLNKYQSEILFFGSAIPLWFIMWRTNEQSITITVIGLMLFIYFMTTQQNVATSSAIVKENAPAPAPTAETRNTTGNYFFEEPGFVGWRFPTPKTKQERNIAAEIDLILNNHAQSELNKTHDRLGDTGDEQLIAAFENTHEDARNVLIAINKYFARMCPNIVVDNTSINERRRNAFSNLTQIMEFTISAKETEQLDFDSMGRIKEQVSCAFSGQSLVARLSAIVECINNETIEGYNFSDTQLFLVCDMLTEAWYKVMFEHKNYAQSDKIVSDLFELTCKFIKKNQPGEFKYDGTMIGYDD